MAQDCGCPGAFPAPCATHDRIDMTSAPPPPALSALRAGALSLVLLGGVPAVERADIDARIAAMADHPRLFLDSAGEQALRARLEADPLLTGFHRAAIAEADAQLKTSPAERVMVGRRLLGTSRTCLSRLTHLSYAWRLTGEAKYLERAKAEMLAVATFSDWNPSHFLDVAEMTAGMAIAYDWLFAGLDESSRATVRTAILDKGVTPSIGTSQWWISKNNNWNQVCHAGMVLGALAVHEAGSPVTGDVVARAVDGVRHAMVEFGPDGAYPEGPSYWSYGTTFNVLLISALESALRSDFKLTTIPGFLATADYYLHVTGPTNLYFNYVDCGSGGGTQPAMFWFAAHRQDPHLLWTELGNFEAQLAKAGSKPVRSSDRLFPLLLAWSSRLPAQRTAPPTLSWTGDGLSPVAMHRSAWTAEATYVGFKGGSPSTNHGHMDVGTFVMDADDVRWAADLGMQDYHSLESRQVDLWNLKQDSQRWQIFRLGASSHNILTVDGQQQVVKGRAPIVVAKPGRTVIDTSAVYQDQFTTSLRGVALLADRSVLIQDEFTASRDSTVRWAMVTPADATVTAPGQATLAQKGRTLAFRVLEPAQAEVRIWSTEPPTDIDAPNPGTRLIGFEVRVPMGEARRLVVHLVPGGGNSTVEITPCQAW